MVEGSTKRFSTPKGAVQLVKLTSDLPQLVEMNVYYSKTISADATIRFMQNHPKLMRVKFSISPGRTFDRFEIELLRKRFEHEWHVRVFHDKQGCYMMPQLTLERKNATLSNNR